MLTGRAWWFLSSVLFVLAMGLLAPRPMLTLLALALLLWFGGQWLLFAIGLLGLRRLHLIRQVCNDKSTVFTLWAWQTFEVRLRLKLSSRFSLPHVAATDQLPFNVQHVDGPVAVQGVLHSQHPLTIRYRIRCGPAGRTRFEGVRLHFTDRQGFFSYAHYVRAAVELPVLPLLLRRSAQPASKKRSNRLMPPGIHRLRQPGTGSELLDLRDYMPGDPPKTIAWKVSARRDRLITKEFESEVPVRCTLFVDASNSVRLPGLAAGGQGAIEYGKALDRLVDLAAGILQVNARIRDLTGLCLFDENGFRTILPQRGGVHLTTCLRRLADAAALAPQLGRVEPNHLLPLAYSFAHQVYPELLHPSINATPWRAIWLDGFSGYSRRFPFGLFEMIRLGVMGSALAVVRRPRTLLRRVMELFHRRKYELRVFCWWSALAGLLVPLGLFAAVVFFKAPIPFRLLTWTLIGCPLASLLLWGSAFFFFGLDIAAGGGQRRRERWRKKLAALLSVRYGLAPHGLAALLEDDDAFSHLVQRFLSEHRLPYTLPLYDGDGRYLFAAPEKISVLADALLQAVARGHDNELFVLLADLLELDDSLDPLLRAVRVALSRHHQVMLICPWPPGLPPPTRKTELREGQTENSHPPFALWDEMMAQRFQRAYRRLRRTFARLGVPVLCAADDEPIPLILRRLERLRAPGRPPR